MDVNPRNPLLPLAPREGGYYYPWKWCSVGVETAVLKGGKRGVPPQVAPSPTFLRTPNTPTTVNVSRNPSGMDDGRSPSGGADTLKGGKGGMY